MTNAITPIVGSNGSDTLNGGATGDVMSGRQGKDTINANAGNDLAHGGGASDLINGGSGNDALFGGGGPGLLDMTQLTIAEDHMGRLTFISEGAGFQNSLVMYKVDAKGMIGAVDVLFANSSAKGSGGDLLPGQSFVDVSLRAGDQIGFMVASNAFGRPTSKLLTDPKATFELRNAAGEIANVSDKGNLTLWHVASNGTRTAIQTQYGTNTFHSAANPDNGYALNADRFAHTVGRIESADGTIVLGFEDLWNGGDKDFDDIVFRLDVGKSNARVLDPNLAYGEAGEGNTWVWTGSGQRATLDGRIIAPENDTIFGGTGDDQIHGGVDHDRLYGGDGADTINGNSGADILWGDAGNDLLNGGKGDDTLHGGTGSDALNGDSGNDLLNGGDGADTLNGGDGIDLLNGESGNDVLTGGGDADTLFGGVGDDRLDGGSGNDLADGGAGTDTLEGGSGDDTLSGGDGNDQLAGSAGSDHLRGDAGDDGLDGGSGDDVLEGGLGRDTLTGGAGNDRLDGGIDADDLRGGTGDDVVLGEAGNDKLAGDSGADTLSGGAGNDQLFGGEGDDRLAGDAGDDRLEGGKGDDLMQGGAGNDRLLGGDGADRLDGGTGVDVLSGGLGADCFVFNAASTAQASITDFECGIDRIELSGLLGAGFDLSDFRADSFALDNLGGVRISVGDLSIDVANRSGAADFATQVWESLTFI